MDVSSETCFVFTKNELQKHHMVHQSDILLCTIMEPWYYQHYHYHYHRWARNIWVPTTGIQLELFAIRYQCDSHVNYACFNGFHCAVLRYQPPFRTVRTRIAVALSFSL